MTPDRGDWIQVFTGRKFYPFDPSPGDVCLDDLAHHLANICRFTGAPRKFYSVAQHCVIGADAFLREGENDAARYFLLHDGSEAYLSDIARPVKRAEPFAFYRAVESRVQAAVYRAFGLDIIYEPASVGFMDRVMLRTEQRDLMPPPAEGEDRDDATPLPRRICPWSSVKAERHFRAMARALDVREVIR